MRRRVRLLLLISPLFVLLPFAPALLDGAHAFLVRDLMRSFLPAKAAWIHAVEAGNFPFWNHAVGLGAPFWSDMSLQPLWPLNAVLLFFPGVAIHYAFSWYLAAHLPFLLLAVFLFLRASGCSRRTALMGGFFLSWSGLALSTVNSPNILAAAIALPLYFAGLLRSWRRLNAMNVALGSAGLALAFYGGAPDFAYLAALAAPFFQRRFHFRGFLLWGGITALGVLAAGPQLFPFLHLFGETQRGSAGLTYNETVISSLHPMRLLEFLRPFPWGDFVAGDYDGYKYVNGPLRAPFFFSIYLGVGLFLGAVVSFFRRMGKRQRLMAAVFLLLSFGYFGPIPLNKALYDWFPFWSMVRYPEKIVWISLWLLLPQMVQGFSYLMRRFAQMLPVSFPAVLKSAVFLAIISELLWISPRLLLPQPAELLVSPELLEVSKRINARAIVITQGGAQRFSSVLATSKRSIDGEFHYTPSALGVWPRLTMAVAKTMSPNVPSIFGIEVAESYSGVYSPELREWWMEIGRKNSARLFDVLSVRYLLDRTSDGPVFLRENESAFPYVFSAEGTEFSETSLDAARKLSAAQAVSPRFVLVASRELSAPLAKITGIQISVKNEQRIGITANKAAGTKGFLVVNSKLGAGWRATINGAEAPLVLANGWAIGVVIPENIVGAFTLELRYFPPYLLEGLVAFFLWAALLLAWAIYSRRARGV